MKTKEELFKKNIALVHDVINKHFIFCKGKAYYEDVVQVGKMGLWKAINDCKEGLASLGTYAFARIKGEISSYVYRNELQIKRYSNFDNAGISFSSLNVLAKEDGTEIMEMLEDEESYHLFDTLNIGLEAITKGITKHMRRHEDNNVEDVDVVTLIANGLTRQEVADRLGIKQSTVSARLRRVKAKLIQNNVLKKDLRGGLYIAN